MMNKILLVLLILAFFLYAGCTSTSFQVHTPEGLENTKWILDTLDNARITTAAGKEITLQFDSETKKINGFGGCNSYFGTVKKELDRLTFSGIGSTKMACNENMQNETNYFAELPKVNKYDIRNNLMYLFNNGYTVMVFHEK